MRDSVPSGSYSSVCNVLRQWKSRSSLLIESTDSMIYIYIYIFIYIIESVDSISRDEQDAPLMQYITNA